MNYVLNLPGTATESLTPPRADSAHIVSAPVPDDQRIAFWPRHFGCIPQWITLEPRIFAWMERFCADYSGGTAVCPELAPADQQKVREALILLEYQLREPGPSFTSSQAVRDWLRLNLATLEREAFTVLWLDNQHRLTAHDTLFLGTINSITVHPREVVKAGLKHNAAAVILAHNHPSGEAEPSDADRQITARLKQALELVDIRLLDHLVVGGMDIVSFAERGWL